MNDQPTPYIYKSTLKTLYGLSDGWIARLGAPDKTRPNPHYKCAPEASLYLRERVETFLDDNREEYERFILKRIARQSRAKTIADHRTSDLLAWADTVKIKIGSLPDSLSALEWAATESFLTRQYDRGRCEADYYPGHNALVAYVRHRLTNYENLLAYIEGRPGHAKAYLRLKVRVNQVIERELAERYYQAEKLLVTEKVHAQTTA